ncbi:Plasmodium exported protein (PHIST), unknown function [Plasmodium ovale wallikeri]|uniref:Plasmodium RESA N-terminal domain-containing protein n=1 Tax=Plasmodium ovale wallikeri TaxID=864142 RepID=A0A1A9ADH2_PLAOA|nr:Phist protein (Pf-fam-b), unknown function [Plasmodium ovale wallikeri]SBT56156.1 Plasmodium exported protein (PHIST), unknown function [Plasmodium ovale wallikeri]
MSNKRNFMSSLFSMSRYALPVVSIAYVSFLDGLTYENVAATKSCQNYKCTRILRDQEKMVNETILESIFGGNNLGISEIKQNGNVSGALNESCSISDKSEVTSDCSNEGKKTEESENFRIIYNKSGALLKNRIKKVGKRFTRLKRQLSENDIDSLISTLKEKLTEKDVRDSWWEIRDMDRYNYVLAINDLENMFDKLKCQYNTKEDKFTEELWKRCTNDILQELVNAESDFNKEFYVMIKKSPLERNVYVDLIRNCSNTLMELKKEQLDKWEKELAYELKKKCETKKKNKK